MLTVPQCYVCKHFNHGEKLISCKAYPNGIPDEIYSELEPHNKINIGQVGYYVYKPEVEEENEQEVPEDIKSIFDHIKIRSA